MTSKLIKFICWLFLIEPFREFPNIELSFKPFGSERRIRPYRYVTFFWGEARFTHGSCTGDENEIMDTTFYCDDDLAAETFLKKICREQSWRFYKNMSIRVRGGSFPDSGVRSKLIGLGVKRLPDKPILIRIVLR